MGYTSITLTKGNDINQIQFLAGSGWGLQTSFMQFQLLNDGGVVLSGVVPISSGNCSTGFWQSGGTCNGGAMPYFGFSGGGFDEVRLQNQGAPAGQLPWLVT